MNKLFTIMLMLFLSFVLIASASAQVWITGIKGTTEAVKIFDGYENTINDLHFLAFINTGKMLNSYMNLSEKIEGFQPISSGMEKSGGEVFACSKHSTNDNLLNETIFNRFAYTFKRC
ncbi:MAG: hypothetical protein KAS30_01585 [Candidatus Diapherotrites archaeon]|nr:hypothetical protein [Candidatus Diapherotrites archaeon]